MSAVQQTVQQSERLHLPSAATSRFSEVLRVHLSLRDDSQRRDAMRGVRYSGLVTLPTDPAAAPGWRMIGSAVNSRSLAAPLCPPLCSDTRFAGGPPLHGR
jgi:hypothetical protein